MYAFSGPPQPVEISHRGIWYRGELLGWRNEPDGRCVARVRCVVGKLRHSAWVALADLRLPEPGALATQNPPIDLGAARPRVTPAAPTRGVPPLPRGTLAPRPAANGDDDTRPHELLPLRTTRSRPVARPLPPPRAYRQPAPQEPTHRGQLSSA